MASVDVLVHGCEAETFCMAAAEARASGTPVIVPDRGGAADHADDPSSRRYAAAKVDALREAIVGLADAPRPRTSSLQTPVRTIDAHFADLFGLYAGFHVPLREAA